MIRTVIIDGHPVMRAGIAAILARTDDVVVVADASGEPHEVEHVLYRTAPDVVIIEHAACGLDGVELTRLVKARPPAPRVVVHADWVDATLVATAMLAGADALVESRAQSGELVAAVRSAARGRPLFPELDLASRAALARLLPSEDEPILRMYFAAVAPREIARKLGLDARTLRARMRSMIESLRTAGGARPAPAPG